MFKRREQFPTPDTRKERAFSDQFEIADKIEREKLARYEVETAERENSIISDVIAAVATVVRRYGRPAKECPREMFHILQPGAVEAIMESGQKGFYNRLTSNVAVDRQESKVGFAIVIAHELFHHNGVKGSFDMFKDSDLQNIEEGAVSELEMQAYKTLKEYAAYREEIEATETIKSWIDRVLTRIGLDEASRAQILDDIYAVPMRQAQEILTALAKPADEGYKLGYFTGWFEKAIRQDILAIRSRIQERRAFNSLIERLRANGRENRSRQTIRDDLLRAFLTEGRSALRDFLSPKERE